ncbi:sarcosine oxidase subunit alpha family protein [Kiloniella laminariae]|uniref:Sarcosine oxidase subunit alpha family protein n=1 Tax=Kiloniella laminariae TaxID=454162 RepID=A0ABT4LPK1_9PROT|nr:sarcosine oxidase subunit alpha family protein [Kiloniella laminariae]MCZ4283060.1 sarcosine oxidase subunit alpha family protein [Kiloniella laminariae]
MSKQPNRLSQTVNECRIDRTKPIQFIFNGKSYQGYQGDTLASALLANGVTLIARSFKYHRPRGILTADAHEPSALVQLGSGSKCEPNIPATTIELYDGLEARSQNCWPSLAFDVMSINSLFSPIFVAGFYYKTFKWPAKFWTNFYEPIIRKAAGMGELSGKIDPDTYEKAHDHCDVLVIGGGISGIMAAKSAADSGAQVILCDENPVLGGQISDGKPPLEEVSGKGPLVEQVETLLQLRDMNNVRIMPRSMVFGWYDNNTFGVIEQVSDHLPQPEKNQPRQRMRKIVAQQIILATGSHERSLVFPNNDRPGVMLASAVQRYIRQYSVRPGQKAVIFTNNDSTKKLVNDLNSAGIIVSAYVDAREDITSDFSDIQCSNILNGYVVDNVHGGKKVQAVTLRPCNGGPLKKIDCDLICVSGGWNPAVQLLAQRGQKPQWSENYQNFLPQFSTGEDFLCTGSLAGLESTRDCLDHARLVGEIAGKRISGNTNISLEKLTSITTTKELETHNTGFFEVLSDKGKSFIDLQNDVTRKDVELAAREGYRSVEHVKRYTTLGMATDQGKTSNINGIATLSRSLNKPISQVGTTGFRPPYRPVSLGVLAGRSRGKHWRPILRTPLHNWVYAQGGKFIESGLWHRSQYFPINGETMAQSIDREVRTVREKVGFCDVSTLGKIDLQGPDAATFLNRVYCNGFAKLPVGRSRYGLMLREDGIVFDDGTVTRLDDDHYFITTTSAESCSIVSHLEYCHQVLWPELDICLADVGEDWAAIALAGPHSRKVLSEIVDNLDVSNDTLPFLKAVTTTVLGGLETRLFRISFSGEMAYELFVPSQHGADLAKMLMIVGEKYGIAPYGVEALDVLRIEKGHVSSELNKFTTASDLGLGGMMSKTKDYIGHRLSQRPGLIAPDREVVVGLLPLNPKHSFAQGAHIITTGTSATAENDDGYITSAAWSPTLNSYIGIALVRRGRERIGQIVDIVDPLNGKKPVTAKIVSHHFYDLENTRVTA